MNNFEFTAKKIVRFVYMQPEISVSIKKLKTKFRQITIDELDTIIQEMAENNWLELSPKSDFSFTTVASLNDDGLLTEHSGNEPKALVQPTHVSLTLKGKDKALEQHALILQARKELVMRPVINTLISGIVGFVLGYLVHLI